ncbi:MULTISPECIES: hypothetical protein [unclassified Ensifer]|uniref:hypothetical protein n=1 Tax=unclassified Ensifer TaxID=2633371 RepID=UPI00081395CA|nr:MULTISPECIES: hypothetical protein [unclassified Ensifer]OCP17437.1 hypothetical protein BC361_08240 [Ensifer sp. LC54]OCP28657.1 hypothetical protein BC363_02115 [Ensifer sp. LC384]
MNPVSLEQLVAADRIAPVQKAIVANVGQLLTGVAIKAHPGKVDVSELIAKSVVKAPGIGIGWSRIRRAALNDGAFCLVIEWVAYIVAEAHLVGGRRREKEEIALAIGGRLMHILADQAASLWGLDGLLPPEETPAPELKPLFTLADMAKGAAYYTVTWTQTIIDLGDAHFPAVTATTNPDNGTIDFLSPGDLALIERFIPGREVVGDA